MYSPKVPNWIRYGMPPFLAFAGHAIFFAANFTPGCGINVKVKVMMCFFSKSEPLFL